MMMFLLLCFIWSQKKSLTQTGENLLCFTFKLWLLSASDSASINLCCLREIVSTSLTFRFQQLEYQVFPFKSLFWSCTCSRNKKLVHWNPPQPPISPACCLWTFPECSGPQEKGCWDFNLSNIQTVRFISMKFLLEIFPSFSWLNFCKIFPSRVRFLGVSLRLHRRLFLVLPQNFLSHTSPKPHPTSGKNSPYFIQKSPEIHSVSLYELYSCLSSKSLRSPSISSCLPVAMKAGSCYWVKSHLPREM